MIKNRFILNENDRRNILSMYGLLVEEVKDVIISGVVTDDSNTPRSGKVYLKDTNGKIIKQQNTDFDGNYSINANLEINKSYIIVFKDDETQRETPFDLEVGNETTIVKNLKITLKVLELSGVQVGLSLATKIDLQIISDSDLKKYELSIFTNEKELLYTTPIYSKNINLIFLGGNGMSINQNDIGVEKPVGTYTKKIDNFFNVNAGDKKEVIISIGNKLKTIYSEKFSLKLNNGTVKIDPVYGKNTSEVNGETLSTNKETKAFFNQTNAIGPNIINIEIGFSDLKLKIFDEVTGEPVENAEVSISGFDQSYTTNNEGKIFIEDIKMGDYKLRVKHPKYLIKTKEIKLNKKINEINLTLIKIGLSDERIDDYRDTLFTIYGRSRTDLSYDNALVLAKLDVVNKYLEKHKKKYKNIPKFEGVDVDIDYELVYKKPNTSKGKENFVIIKAKKKDVKNFIKNYSLNKGYEIEVEPITWENEGLESLLIDSYRRGKTVVIVLGLTDDDGTINLINDINKNSSVINNLNTKSQMIFVPVSNKNENYNYLIQKKIVTVQDSYPRVISLKPTDLKGDFTLNFNLPYSRIKNDISQIKQ